MLKFNLIQIFALIMRDVTFAYDRIIFEINYVLWVMCTSLSLSSHSVFVQFYIQRKLKCCNVLDFQVCKKV